MKTAGPATNLDECGSMGFYFVSAGDGSADTLVFGVRSSLVLPEPVL